MTTLGRLVSCFPVVYLIGLISLVLTTLKLSSVPLFIISILYIYLVPLMCFRIHNLIFPLTEGEWDLSEKKYNPWWASYMFQFPFIAVPMFESFLHFIPGLYSVWLRSWGSEIGKRVFWTPKVEILDRGLVKIEDGVVIGHLTAMSSHVVSEIDGKPFLLIKKIKIGKKSLVGADTQLGPGAEISAYSKLKPKTRLYWKGSWP